MASPPIPGGPSGVGPGPDPLAGPPPSPDVRQAVAPAPSPDGMKGLAPDDPSKTGDKMYAGVTQVADQMDKILLALARTVPEGAKDFAIARKAIERGVKAGLAKVGQAPANSPVAAGSGFPGPITGGRIP